MNILPRIEARTYKTGAEIIAEAMRRKLRFASAAQQEKPKVAEEVKLARYKARQAPLWDFEAIYFDQHVIDFRRHLWMEVERQANPPRAFLRDRCEELGISYDVIISKTRTRKVSDVRQLLMWEVHSKFGLSYPAIGRMFGGRDHTTAIYSVSKIEAERNADAAKAQEFVARKILMREKAHHYRELSKRRPCADV
jgi:hypothetical protein